MQPRFHKIHFQPEHSFNVRHDVVKHFTNEWHYHPEIELIHIVRGSGRQFIGDNVHHFKANDMFLLGANLPHLFRPEEKYLSKGSKLKMEAIIVHFTPDCLGGDFFLLPESRELSRLLNRASRGVRVKDRTRMAVGELLQQLTCAKNTERIILLLKILHLIANSRETRPVSSKGLQFHFNTDESDRLNRIYQYIMNNFSGEITLTQIAAIAHLSPHAFCKYFKSRIKKTFSRFLMEVRIGHACKLLAETDHSISDICFESGFNNYSNFNRHFKEITGRTPLSHRKHYQHLQQLET